MPRLLAAVSAPSVAAGALIAACSDPTATTMLDSGIAPTDSSVSIADASSLDSSVVDGAPVTMDGCVFDPTMAGYCFHPPYTNYWECPTWAQVDDSDLCVAVSVEKGDSLHSMCCRVAGDAGAGTLDGSVDADGSLGEDSD